MSRGRELLPSDLPIIEKGALDHLLQVQVLDLAATAADKTKATELADKRLVSIKKRAPSEEALERQLKTMNLTVDGLRARLIEEAEAEQVLRDKVAVTDEQVTGFVSRRRVGAIADVVPAQFGGQRALDRQVESLDLGGDGGPVAGGGRGGGGSHGVPFMLS